MKKDTKIISRIDLYKRVWETPVTHLAKEYGLSDVGFAKICKKHNIPRPPRGYWARIAAGQRLKKLPLPNRSSEGFIEISPNLSNRFSSLMDSKLLQQNECEKKFPPIVVAKSLRKPHPLVSQSCEILEMSQLNDIGILEPTDKMHLNIRVSRKSLRRALRIMDALLKGLLRRGFKVYQEECSVQVQIHGECLTFGISEEIITLKTQSKDTNLDGYYEFGHSRFDQERVPSGKLCLTIHDHNYYWGNNFRKNWRDTKRKQLEDSLDAFVIGLIKRAVKKKEYRHEKEEEKRQQRELARQREEEQNRLAELKRQVQQEQTRVSKLITDAENYHKSKQVRNFIAAVENEQLKDNPVYVTDDDYENWVKWALDQADRLDPLTESPESILDKVPEDNDEQPNENKGFKSHCKKW